MDHIKYKNVKKTFGCKRLPMKDGQADNEEPIKMADTVGTGPVYSVAGSER